MKRYLLFSSQHYYPDGGWQDFRGTFETIELCKDQFDNLSSAARIWGEIVDTKTAKVVLNYSGGWHKGPAEHRWDGV